jgi:hypothetical protein
MRNSTNVSQTHSEACSLSESLFPTARFLIHCFTDSKPVLPDGRPHVLVAIQRYLLGADSLITLGPNLAFLSHR